MNTPNPITNSNAQSKWLETNYTYYTAGASLGNLQRITDPKGNATEYTYDAIIGTYITQIKNVLGKVTTYAYYGIGIAQDKGLYGQLKNEIDPNGNAIYYSYDGFGRSLRMWVPGDNETSPTKRWSYSPLGDPTSQNVIEYSKAGVGKNYWTQTYFDGLARTIQAHKGSDGLGADDKEIRVTTLYDDLGRANKSSLPYFATHGAPYNYVVPDASVKWSTTEFDGLGRPIKITNPDNTYKSAAYNGFNIIKTDENGKTRDYTMDAYGRLNIVQEHNDGLIYNTQYQYYVSGNIKAVINSRGKAIEFYYDSFGRKIKTVDPDRGVWQFEYDDAGNIACQLDGNNKRTDFTYDNLNRIKTKTNEAGTVTYTYDIGGNAIGRLTAVQEPTGTVTFAYNNKGQLITEQRQLLVGSVLKTYVIGRRYNAGGQLDTLIYPDGTPDGEKVPYRYNSFGQLVQVGTYGKVNDYTAAGQMSSLTYGNDLSASYVYDPDRLWMTQLKNGPLTEMNYGYDAVGNITSITKPVISSDYVKWSYQYDDLYRLKGETYQGRRESMVFNYYDLAYTYDALGNRQTMTDVLTGNVTSYGYDVGTSYNRLQTDGYHNYDYDQNGNIKSDGIYNYEYNADNRLANISVGTSSTDYGFNSVGLRVKKVVTSSRPDIALDAAVVDDPYDDLTLASVPDDGHNKARDLGQIKVHANSEFLFFEINHQYLYGTNQGDYSHLYISIDTDQKMGSGNMFFPDGINTGLEAASAWEYCLYVYNEKNFGIYEQNLNQLANPSVGCQKMQVNFIPSNNGKVKIKVPKALIGNPETIRFVILTSKPGTSSTGTSTAMDVVPGGMNAIIGGIVYGSTEVYVSPRPGTVITSVEATYYLYDEQGRTLCEIDNSGNLKSKFYYLNGQLLARSNIVGTTPADGTPLNNTLDDQTFCADAYGSGDGSVDCQFITETADKKEGDASLKVVTSTGATFGNFRLSDPNVSWQAQDYRYVHVWVKPSAGAQWLTFHISDYGADGTAFTTWRDMTNYTDGDIYFKVGKDLIANQWNEVWIDLYKNKQLLKEGYVKGFHIHSNCGSNFYFDHFYTTANSGFDLAYYHNDHLGSPRAMTNAWGAVTWRQDYMAFGQDYAATATGNNYKFNGKPQEAAGLYYYGARYYNPELGRFVSCDPVMATPQNPQSLNPYNYCSNNPVCYVDPLGLYEESMIIWDGEIVSVKIMSMSEYNDSESANENRESSGTTQLPTTQPAESDATQTGQGNETLESNEPNLKPLQKALADAPPGTDEVLNETKLLDKSTPIGDIKVTTQVVLNTDADKAKRVSAATEPLVSCQVGNVGTGVGFNRNGNLTLTASYSTVLVRSGRNTISNSVTAEYSQPRYITYFSAALVGGAVVYYAGPYVAVGAGYLIDRFLPALQPITQQ